MSFNFTVAAVDSATIELIIFSPAAMLLLHESMPGCTVGPYQKPLREVLLESPPGTVAAIGRRDARRGKKLTFATTDASPSRAAAVSAEAFMAGACYLAFCGPSVLTPRPPLRSLGGGLPLPGPWTAELREYGSKPQRVHATEKSGVPLKI